MFFFRRKVLKPPTYEQRFFLWVEVWNDLCRQATIASELFV